MARVQSGSDLLRMLSWVRNGWYSCFILKGNHDFSLHFVYINLFLFIMSTRLVCQEPIAPMPPKTRFSSTDFPFKKKTVGPSSGQVGIWGKLILFSLQYPLFVSGEKLSPPDYWATLWRGNTDTDRMSHSWGKCGIDKSLLAVWLCSKHSGSADDFWHFAPASAEQCITIVWLTLGFKLSKYPKTSFITRAWNKIKGFPVR